MVSNGVACSGPSEPGAAAADESYSSGADSADSDDDSADEAVLTQAAPSKVCSCLRLLDRATISSGPLTLYSWQAAWEWTLRTEQ